MLPLDFIQFQSSKHYDGTRILSEKSGLNGMNW